MTLHAKQVGNSPTLLQVIRLVSHEKPRPGRYRRDPVTGEICGGLRGNSNRNQLVLDSQAGQASRCAVLVVLRLDTIPSSRGVEAAVPAPTVPPALCSENVANVQGVRPFGDVAPDETAELQTCAPAW